MNAVSAMLRSARWYGQHGLYIFPIWPPAGSDCTCPARHRNRDAATGRCRDPGKHPRTEHGHQDATTTATVIEQWWAAWPDSNIGIACKPSSLAVLDVDPRHGGDESFVDVERQHGPLPETWRVLTGGGGLHLPFQAPDSVALVDGEVAPGLDFKANGYIVAVPSFHVSGQRYAWEIGCEPWSLPLAPLPAWVVEQRRAGAARTDRLRADETPLVLRTGARNQRLFQLATALRRYGVGADALRTCLDAINRAHAVPPLSTSELTKVAESAARYEAALPCSQCGSPLRSDAPAAPADGVTADTLVIRRLGLEVSP